MTIAILMQTEATKIPRPFNRACSQGELVEMIEYFDAAKRSTMPLRDKVKIDLACIDTDESIATVTTPTGPVDFYAFTER